MPKTRIFYWVHHTGIAEGNTGVQRMCGCLPAGWRRTETLSSCGSGGVLRARRSCVRRACGCGDSIGPSLEEPSEPAEALHLAAADAGRLFGAWLLIPEVTHLPSPAYAPNALLALALDYARYYQLRSALISMTLFPSAFRAMSRWSPTTCVTRRPWRAPISFCRSLGLRRTILKAWWREQAYDPDRLPTVRPVLLRRKCRA